MKLTVNFLCLVEDDSFFSNLSCLHIKSTQDFETQLIRVLFLELGQESRSARSQGLACQHKGYVDGWKKRQRQRRCCQETQRDYGKVIDFFWKSVFPSSHKNSDADFRFDGMRLKVADTRLCVDCLWKCYQVSECDKKDTSSSGSTHEFCVLEKCHGHGHQLLWRNLEYLVIS